MLGTTERLKGKSQEECLPEEERESEEKPEQKLFEQMQNWRR